MLFRSSSMLHLPRAGSAGVFFVLALSILACGGGDEPAAPKADATPAVPVPPPAPKEEGAFLAWYNPTGMVYRSADGKQWDTVAALPQELVAWYNSFASDAGGRLYVVDMRDDIWTSGDGAKTWTKVTKVEPRPAGMDSESLVICGGAANELAAVSSAGRSYWSTDAGQSWTEKTRIAPEGAAGSGGGFQGGCAFSADGSKVALEGWYFSPQNPQLAVSTDKGATWTAQPRPGENVGTSGMGFVTGGIAYGRGGGYGPGTVSLLADGSSVWTHSADLRGAAGSEYAQQVAATDGRNTVVVWQAPAVGSNGAPPVPALAFTSTDGGKTFTEAPGPVAADPTPDLSDTYQAIFWTNGKTPGPIPGAAAAVAPPAPVAVEAPKAAPAKVEPPKAEAPKAEPAKVEVKKAPAPEPKEPDASHKQGKGMKRKN